MFDRSWIRFLIYSIFNQTNVFLRFLDLINRQNVEKFIVFCLYTQSYYWKHFKFVIYMKLRFIKQGVTYLLFTEVSFLIFGDGFQKRTKIKSSPRGAKVVIGFIWSFLQNFHCLTRTSLSNSVRNPCFDPCWSVNLKKLWIESNTTVFQGGLV